MPEQEIPRVPMTTEEIEAANLGAPTRPDGRIVLRDHDPRWPAAYEREAAGMAERLAHLDHRIEHVGSTSVPGLPAKPVVDMLLIVPDSADEAAYVPALEALGYRLAVREPDWYEHRVLRRYAIDPSADYANLHVLSAGCPEIGRMLRFRDRLRRHRGDRELYADAKRALAEQSWEYLQNYADAKTEVIAGIIERAAAEAE
ncbi:GrpB family protein [Kitasatospora sp. MY 5-36]|uniref:GrpB family protein n=1 Tax=Kitasatospora sp. MY 5-36 TaxID=1678027 RepID=UPI001F264591|nr:GrpB family protein [Kitasatospora sp. MY 5-36]